MELFHIGAMKTLRSALLLPLAILTAVTESTAAETISPQALPGRSWAEVKLPYRELTALWLSSQDIEKQENKPEQPPPVAALVTAADYELSLATNSAHIAVNYQISKLASDWAEIPLIGGDVRLDGQHTNAHTIAWQKNKYVIITREIGVLNSALTLALPGIDNWTEDVHIAPGPAAINRLKITGLPEGKTIHIKGLRPSRQSPKELVYHFPADGGEFAMSLESYTAPKPPRPLETSDWELQSEILAHYEDGRIHYECLIYATAQNGSGVEMDLLLPRNASDMEFRGDDDVSGKSSRNSKTHRQLNLQWATRDIVDRRIEVSYSVPQSPIETNWTLHPPTLAGDTLQKSLFAIPKVIGLELSGNDLKRSIESRSLPNWLRSKVGANEFLTLEAVGEPALQVQWLPQIKTAQATVSNAEYLTRLVADGSMLVNASCTIDHSAPLNWKLTMPDYDEILSCEVNGTRVQPVDRQEEGLEFPLAQGTKGQSKIVFTYVAKTEVFDAVSGHLELELPKTDLFVHSLKWQLSIPDNYEPTAVEGNVQLATDGPADSINEVHLIKQLIRQEAPAVEVHYQRRGLTD